DLRSAIDHDRPERERVRGDGGDDHGIDVGLEDGPAGGDVVGGRAGGCRDDQPVAADAGPLVAVDAEGEIDHAERRAGGDDQFVDLDIAVNDSVGAADFQFDDEHAAGVEGTAAEE